MRQIHPIFVSVVEAAAMLDKNPFEVSELLAEGAIECRYDGDRCKVRVSSLYDWADSLPTKSRWTA
jgi:hypothetical protein